MSENRIQPSINGLDVREPTGGTARPSLSVRFACANLYQRVLRDADGSGYTARCARCGLCKRFVVGPGGTGQREFVLDCRR